MGAYRPCAENILSRESIYLQPKSTRDFETHWLTGYTQFGSPKNTTKVFHSESPAVF